VATGDVIGCLGARRPPFRVNETVRHTTSVALRHVERAPYFPVADFIHKLIHRLMNLAAGVKRGPLTRV
jgi:hypothetical protein